MFYSKSTSGFYVPEIHGGNIPSDAVEITTAEHVALLEAQSLGKRITSGGDGFPIAIDPPAPTLVQIIDGFTTSIQARLDDFARTRGYDGILSLASYATDPDPKFSAEGQYGVDARSTTWAKSYEIMEAVKAGTRPMPTFAEIEVELPVLAWPTV